MLARDHERSPADLAADIAGLLDRIVADLLVRQHRVGRRLGLGRSELQFLTLLRLNGPMTPSRLAYLSGISTGTATGVLDRLERAGCVEREIDRTDRRSITVVPVRAVLRERLPPLSDDRTDAARTALALLDPDEMKAVRRFLRAIEPFPDPG
jgi:DNA-binding MarR family transcriptional regulator